MIKNSEGELMSTSEILALCNSADVMVLNPARLDFFPTNEKLFKKKLFHFFLLATWWWGTKGCHTLSLYTWTRQVFQQ